MLIFKYDKFKIKIYRKRTLKDIWNVIKYKLFYDISAEFVSKDNKIPEHEIESLARAILPDIIAFFESDIGKIEFEKWQQEQSKRKQDKSA